MMSAQVLSDLFGDEANTSTRNSRGMLVALSRPGKHVYAGTVPAKVVARRRARNKQARRSRRVNRRSA